MKTQFSRNTTRAAALIGAVAWLVLAVAWQASNSLEQTRDWEGLPQALFFVGFVGLLVGGLTLGIVALDATGSIGRPTWRTAGLVLIAIGLILSFAVGWAIPLWSAAYGVGMLSLARSGALRVEGWIIGAALIAAAAAFFILTALEVGAADSFGDYPTAWITATWIAGLGSSAGLLIRSRLVNPTAGSPANVPS